MGVGQSGKTSIWLESRLLEPDLREMSSAETRLSRIWKISRSPDAEWDGSCRENMQSQRDVQGPRKHMEKTGYRSQRVMGRDHS